MPVTLFGAPGAVYAPTGGRVYQAGGDGSILNVADSDKGDMLRAGCIDSAIWQEILAAGIAANRLNQIGALTVYTLLATDDGRRLVSSAATELTLNVPFGLPLGFSCDAVQFGPGDLKPVAAAGVTIFNSQSYVKTAAQYSLMFLRGVAQDVYILSFPNGDGSV